MHSARQQHSRSVHATQPSVPCPTVRALPPVLTCIRSLYIACSSNRLQGIVPSAPTTDEPVDLLYAPISDSLLLVDSDAPLKSQGTLADSSNQTLDQQQDTSEADNDASPSSQQQQSHPQTLLQYGSQSTDWTASYDEDIESAGAFLPRYADSSTDGFVGRRFTFARSPRSTETASPLQPGAEQQLNLHADALNEQMGAIELELQEALSQSDSEASTSTCSSLPDTSSNLDNSHTEDSLAATAATVDETDDAVGAYFTNRSTMLQQLHQQQLQLHRDYILQKQRKNLYSYNISESGRIVKRSKPGPKSPLNQTTFALAKLQPTDTGPAAASPTAGSSSNNSSSPVQQQRQAVQQDRQQLQQQQGLQQGLQQMLPLQLEEQTSDLTTAATAARLPSYSSSSNSSTNAYNSSSSRLTGNQPASTAKQSSRQRAAPSVDPNDPSRGLCLSVFLYCCSQSKLLSLTWQLGLPPNALKFVAKVADADVVLHVKSRPGEKHYHYETYRDQAAEKGIPMVDLKNLSLQELQLYLLPVFQLYAGEVSPRALLKRQKVRNRKRRYTNIKLPLA